MTSVLIDHVKYIEGHSELGEQTIHVTLSALPSNLTIANLDDEKPLFSIPWGNLSGVNMGPVQKRGLDAGGAFVLRAIPGLNILRAGDAHYYGIWITFWDEEIQRSQSPYFAARSDRHARQLMQKIYQHRDTYYRTIGKESKPQRKE